MVESENWRGSAPLISISLVILLPRCWAGAGLAGLGLGWAGWAETGDKVSYIHRGRHHRIQSGVPSAPPGTAPSQYCLLHCLEIQYKQHCTAALVDTSCISFLLETPSLVLVY